MYETNNKILDDFLESYAKVLRDFPELSAKQLSNYYSSKPQQIQSKSKDAPAITSTFSKNSIYSYLQVVINREKAKSGCNFECYEKVLRKSLKLIPNFQYLTFSSLNFDSCVRIAHIFAQHPGYTGTSKAFRNLLGKAGKDKDVNFDISQIGDFKFQDYDPHKNDIKVRKPDVLTQSQLKNFINLDCSKATPKYKNRYKVELFHDFCCFMFYSFFAPCDVIKLKAKDITKDNTLVTKRKKTHRVVEVPISPMMQKIIDKYKGKSKDGYIFPIMDDKKEKKYATRDYIYKKFREAVNVWLKEVGIELHIKHKLYAYVFRHTAITIALDKGLPLSFVASTAGTSIEMIQIHYYNGDGAHNKQKLFNAFMEAAV